MNCEEARCDQPAKIHLTTLSSGQRKEHKYLCGQHAQQHIHNDIAAVNGNATIDSSATNAVICDLRFLLMYRKPRRGKVYLKEVSGGGWLALTCSELEALAMLALVKDGSCRQAFIFDALLETIRASGSSIELVRISHIQGRRRVAATIEINGPNCKQTISVSPSDALSLAFRAGVMVCVDKELLVSRPGSP